MKKIYISGQITKDPEYKEKFKKAEIMLKEKGYDPINPCELKHEHERSYEAFMKEDIKALMDCELIYMLDGWRKSDGATAEFELAKFCGIKRLYI